MKIIHKLLIGIVLNTVLIIGISAAAYYSVNATKQEIDELVSDPIPSIIAANELSTSFLSATEDIYAYHILGLEKEKENYNAGVEKFDKAMAELKVLIEDYAPEEREAATKIVTQIDEKWKKFDESANSLILNHEKSKEIDVAQFDSLFSSVDVIIPLLDELIDLEQDEIAEAQEAADKVSDNAVNFILLAILASVISSIAINYLIMRSITKPLRDLAGSVESFGKGESQSRAKASGRDEFSELAAAFNSMADNISQAQAGLEGKIKERTAELETARVGLEKANTGLEAAVAARTTELEQIKLNLEKTVAERTKETVEKMEELEKTNKLMTGREVAMADLKEVNRKLTEELAKAKA